MTMEKTYSLNEILLKAYEEDKNNCNKKRKKYKPKTKNKENEENKKYEEYEKEYEQDRKYQNFKSEKIKDLKKICNTLGINLNDFKGYKGYDIPEFVKDIIKEYLYVEGTKGGFISKLRNGKIEDITYAEKKEFVLGLKKRIHNNEEYTKERKEFIDKLLNMNLYNVSVLTFMNATQALTINHAITTIHNDIKNLRNKNQKDGLIRFRNPKKIDEEINKGNVLQSDIRKQLSHLSSKSICNNRRFLDDSDIDVLIEVYEELINQASEKWNQIVNYFEDVRVEYIEKSTGQKIHSQDILRQVLKEVGGFEKMFYEEEVLNKQVDLDEILNDIKNN